MVDSFRAVVPVGSCMIRVFSFCYLLLLLLLDLSTHSYFWLTFPAEAM
jgi:hypothetical protein